MTIIEENLPWILFFIAEVLVLIGLLVGYLYSKKKQKRENEEWLITKNKLENRASYKIYLSSRY